MGRRLAPAAVMTMIAMLSCCLLLFFVFCALSVSATSVAEYTWSGSGTNYHSGTFYISNLEVSSGWNSNARFTEYGFVEAWNHNWAACATSGVSVTVGAGSTVYVTSAVAPAYGTGGNVATTFQFTTSLAAGSYWLQFTCIDLDVGIRFLNTYIVNSCGPYGASVASSIATSPAAPLYPYYSPIVVTVIGTSFTQCGQSFNLNIGTTTVTPSAVTDTTIQATVPALPVGTYQVNVTWLGPFPGTNTAGSIVIASGHVASVDSDRMGGPVSSWTSFPLLGTTTSERTLTVYGQQFGTATSLWTLISSDGTNEQLPCIAIQRNATELVFSIPAATTDSAVGWRNSYRVLYADNMVFTDPIPIGYSLEDHVVPYTEKLVYAATFTGPWSGGLSVPLVVHRTGQMVWFSLDAFSTAAESYSGTPAPLYSTSTLAERFRPLSSSRRCPIGIKSAAGVLQQAWAIVDTSGHITIGADNSGASFGFVPAVVPTVCRYNLVTDILM